MSCPTCTSDTTKTCACRGKHRCAIAACLLVGLIALGTAGLLRDGLRDFQGEKRTVSVRGLSEREVRADLAAWPFILSSTANELTAAQATLDVQEKDLRDFLQTQDLPLGDLTLLRYDVQDLLAQQYRPEGVERGRYVLTKILLLRTDAVDKVEQAAQSIDILVKKGVTLGTGSQPNFLFTKLNDIKPDMIRQANENAYAAADQFARDSGARVGKIATATQGVFSIDGRDDLPMIGNTMPFTQEMQANKKVRVVTSVTYKLD